jgi:hypothetical protein
MRTIFILILLFSITACTRDGMIDSNPAFPDTSLLLDNRWYLKTFVDSAGVSTHHQGPWIRYTRVNTPEYNGFMYDDSESTRYRVTICFDEIISENTLHKIRFITKDSLVLLNMFNSATYRFSVHK